MKNLSSSKLAQKLRMVNYRAWESTHTPYSDFPKYFSEGWKTIPADGEVGFADGRPTELVSSSFDETLSAVRDAEKVGEISIADMHGCNCNGWEVWKFDEKTGRWSMHGCNCNGWEVWKFDEKTGRWSKGYEEA